MKRVIIGMTGASGLQYAFRLITELNQQKIQTYVVYSKAAQVVAALELELGAKDLQAYFFDKLGLSPDYLKIVGEGKWTSCIASGSNTADAMVVVPCSMGALSSIAVGASDNVLERAADVMLKERKNLILVPRETPFSTIHLRNMLTLSEMGACILPANPGFYHKPTSVSEVVDFVVERILSQLGLATSTAQKWGDDIAF